MQIAKIENPVPMDYRDAFPGTSFPASGPSDAFLTEQGYAKVSQFKEHDRATQKLVTAEPYYEAPWVYTVGVVTKMAEEIAADQASKAETEAKTIKAKVDALWATADKYTSSYISGVAIGLLTIGVMQNKPKAMAVTAWSSAVWAEYYARKALVTLDSVDNHDFSSFGSIPYSVPELQAEAGL